MHCKSEYGTLNSVPNSFNIPIEFQKNPWILYLFPMAAEGSHDSSQV